MKKCIFVFTAILILFSFTAMPAGAASYKGYTYDSRENAVPSQIGYLPSKSFMGIDFGDTVGQMLNPRDLYVTDHNEIYILDSGNNRVLILDENFKLIRSLNDFIYHGEKLTLKEPTGIFVDSKNSIYIADPENFRVLVSDKDGNVQHVLEKPNTKMLADDLDFKPTKVLVDSSGIIYVSAIGVYQGAILYKPNGEFEGFFGTNSVEASASLLLDKFWKNILTDQQVSTISKYIPEEFTSFDIDDRDFLYTVTQTATIQQKIKKLNLVGNNILRTNKFGELESIYVGGVLTSSRFVDIKVGKDKTINVIDQQNNRIFQYDKEGQLLFVFGGSGYQTGTFQSPCAIEKLGEKILVLDNKKSNLTVFEPTAFGSLVLQAMIYYNDGQYNQSAELWQEIIRQDNNYEIGYISIGNALLAEKKYKEAAEYFRLGDDKQGNSDAFEAYRNQIIQKFFPLIVLIFLVLLTIFVVKFGKKKKPDKQISGKISPFQFLFHPVDMAEELKHKNAGSFFYAAIILVLWFLGTVFTYSMTGFRFNGNDPDKMNVFLIFLSTIPLFAVWVISNWGFCTLTNGKGRMKEIAVTNAYCLIPYVVSLYLNLLLSQFCILSEQVFMQWISILGVGWSLAILLGVLSGIHEYSFSQTLLSVFVSVIGVLIVVFLVLLVVSLLQQAYTFIYSILNELLYRY